MIRSVTNSHSSDGGYPAALARGVQAAVARAVADLDATSLSALMGELISVGNATLSSLVANDPPQRTLACREGCAHCCHVQVQASTLEILYIAHMLIENLSPNELSIVKSRVAALDQETHGMPHQGRAYIARPCPMLVEDRCSVYSHRPFVCRAANSADAGDCRAMLAGGGATTVTSYQHQKDVFSTLGRAAAAGLAEANRAKGAKTELEGDFLELTAALHLALQHPDPAAAWAAGTLDFSSAIAPRP